MGLTLEQESWTWYGFVTFVIIFRYTSKIWHSGGIKQLVTEDWLMLLVFAFYTVLIVFINIVAFADTNLINPDDEVVLTAQSIQERTYGSKLVLLVEQCMITTQWGCKICLLLLYKKLTFGLKQNLAVKIVGAYVVLGWVVMEVCYFGVWCRPFHEYWAVPTDNIQCSAAIHHLIMNAVFNISSDIMMLSIPLPLLIHSKLPTVKKAALCILFGMGVFVILCAALNKYYSFAQPFSPMWTFWYVREASVAIMIANIPNCWPLVRRICRFKSFNGSSDNQGTTGHNLRSRTANSKAEGAADIRSFVRSRLASQAISSDPEMAVTWSKRDRDLLSQTESQTNLKEIELDSRSHYGSDISDRSQSIEPLEIWRNVEVTINGEPDTEGGERARGILYGGALVGADERDGFRTKTMISAQDMSRDHARNHSHGLR